MKKNLVVLMIALALILATPTTVSAGGCCPVEQCEAEKGAGLVCWSANAPESAACQADSGTVACFRETKVDEIKSCIGPNGSIPVEQCKEMIGGQSTEPKPRDNKTFWEVIYDWFTG